MENLLAEGQLKETIQQDKFVVNLAVEGQELLMDNSLLRELEKTSHRQMLILRSMELYEKL
jgi:hypothetical protein